MKHWPVQFALLRPDRTLYHCMPGLISRTARVAIFTKHESTIVSKLGGPIIHYSMAALLCICALLGRLPDGGAETNLVDKVRKVVDAPAGSDDNSHGAERFHHIWDCFRKFLSNLA